MKVYSELISHFLNKCHKYSFEIMQNEMGLNTRRTRFEFNKYLYPINFVCFEDNQKLAYYNSSSYTLGLHKKLIYLAKETTLKNILRHELAHMYCFLIHGNKVADHGIEYRDICKKFNWDENVFSAKLSLYEDFYRIDGEIKTEAIISKVQKLLKLADSSNEYESQMATQKANELLLKYNLQIIKNTDVEYYVKSVATAKKKTASMLAVYELLPLFLVRPVFNHTKAGIELEITGTKTNVELAHYISDFLFTELERLYVNHKKENPKLKGIKAKNSFMIGVAKGYKEKVQQNYKNLNSAESKALVIIENELNVAIHQIYRSISSSYSHAKGCSDSESAGRKAGKNLSINPGVNSGRKAKTLLLGLFQK